MSESRRDLDEASLDCVAGGIHVPQLPRDTFPYQDRPLPENFRSWEQDRWYGDFTRERGDRADGDPERAARDNMWKEPDRYEEDPTDTQPKEAQPLADEASFDRGANELGDDRGANEFGGDQDLGPGTADNEGYVETGDPYGQTEVGGEPMDLGGEY